ncbi:hypothetical protein ACFL2K_00530 [Candidatus Margulisiibacteriota bacterium]
MPIMRKSWKNYSSPNLGSKRLQRINQKQKQKRTIFYNNIPTVIIKRGESSFIKYKQKLDNIKKELRGKKYIEYLCNKYDRRKLDKLLKIVEAINKKFKEREFAYKINGSFGIYKPTKEEISEYIELEHKIKKAYMWKMRIKGVKRYGNDHPLRRIARRNLLLNREHRIINQAFSN